MQIWPHSADSFFVWLWRTSWQGSLVVALVVLTQALLPKQISPRWRHALWLLVVIRLALPWSIETRLSLFNWVSPSLPALSKKTTPGVATQGQFQESDNPQGETIAPALEGRAWRLAQRCLWLAGAALLSGHLFLTTYRLSRAIRRQRPVTDPAVLKLFEDCKQEMNVSTPLTLVETSSVSSPALLGFIRPRLLLPAGLPRGFSPEELRYIFLHELGHLKRWDIPLNWLMSLTLIIHWFNPLVWYAFRRLRADRELACDALALTHAHETERRPYGNTIIKLLEHFSRPAIVPGLLGILEPQNQMKRRINMIAKFRKTNDWPILAASVAVTLAMVTLTDAQPGQTASDTRETSQAKPEGPPRIVATSPKIGETEVNPNLTEITVTFDRDMGKGFSWTGGGPDYPTGPEGQKPQWRDKRTCVLPVKLQAAHYYRVGINSTSFQNFRSGDGEPARPSAVYFTTQGASEELKRKATKPMIVGLEPKNGTKDVDPTLKELRVTFNVPMGEGFSWTGSGPQFPIIPEGKKPTWTEDHKTCVLPVELNPGSAYRMGLNSPSHKNFQSAGGVSLDPVTYTFNTK